MARSESDAVAQRPTVEQEIAKFKSFATQDGETSDGKPVSIDPKKPNDAPAGKATADAAAQAKANEEAQRKTAAEAAGDDPDEGDDKGEDKGGEKQEPETISYAEHKKLVARAAQKRVNQLTREKHTLERNYEGRLASLEARLADAEKPRLTKDDPTPIKDPNAPNPKDFEYGELDTRYIEAKVRYEVKKELDEDKAKTSKAKATEAQQAAAEKFRTKFEAFKKEGVKQFGDDFEDEVVESGRAGEWALTRVIAELLFDSPSGPAVAKHLAENPAEAERISKLSDTAQAAAFGRLEARFSSESSDAGKGKKTSSEDDDGKPAPKTTQAPPIPNNRARGAGGKTQVSPDTSDFKAFEAMAMRRET